MKNMLFSSLFILLLPILLGAQKNISHKPYHETTNLEIIPPSFPGGKTALQKYFSSQLGYEVLARKFGIEGELLLQFSINEDGALSEVSLLRGLNHDIDELCLNIAKKLNDWIPANHNGRNLKSKLIVPIEFYLEG